MKKIKLLCLSILIAMNATGQVNFDTYLNNGVYTFDDVFKVTRYEIFDTYKSQFGLTSDDIMELIDEDYIKVDTTDTIRTGSMHARYQQKYKNYIVENRTMSLLSKCDVVFLATGQLAQNLDIDVTSPISEEEALDSALGYINAPLGYSWQDSAIINSLIRSTEDSLGNFDSSVTTYPVGQLVIAKKYCEDEVPENYALCWRFGIGFKDTITHDSVIVDSIWVYNITDTFLSSMAIYVNASDGSIWSAYNPSHGGMTTGDVWTYFNGHRYDIKTRQKGIRYKLDDLTNNFDQYYHTSKYASELVTSNDNSWVNDYEKRAAVPYWSIQKAYEYFKWKQYANFNTKLRVYANSTQVSLGGIAYPSWAQLYSPGHHEIHVAKGSDVLSTANLEMMAHELTHVLNYERGKVGVWHDNSDDAMGINEGFCDIFGLLTESWVNGWCDWSWSDDGFWGQHVQRSFHDPQNDAFLYAGFSGSSAPSYTDTRMGDVPPYSNSGPLRKWFNHLSQGEWNWSPAYSGVGLDIAGRIAFLTFYYLVNNNTNYISLSQNSLDVAAFHYGGKCSPVWKKVERAWYDVGVIDQLTSCWRYRLDDAGVIKQEGNPDPGIGYFLVRSNGGGFGEEEPEDDIISYSWSLPAHWTGTFSNDNDMFTLTDVDDDYSSQEYSVIVEYVPEGLVDTVYDTLKSVIHFSAFCTGEESGAKPGRPTNISTKVTTLSNVKVYPNPTDKHLVIEGAAQGTTIQLFNLVGQEVLQSAITKGMEIINTSQFLPGVYILSLTDVQGNKETRRIVKQ